MMDRTNTYGAPLVSIVIPCYIRTPAEAALLEETLGTVAEQRYRNYEIIIVDDGSPLDLPHLDVGGRPVTRLRQDNAGSAAARNTGIAASRGQYLLFLDADDHLLPQTLEVALEAFTAHPQCGFVVGPREEMNFDGTPVSWPVPKPPAPTDIYTSLLRFDWYIIPPSSAMFRREAVESVGGFRDPWGADDLDFYLRVAHGFPGWCYQDPAVTRYRRYSTSSSRDGERMLNSIRQVYQRQWPIVAGDPEREAAFHHGLQQLTEIFIDCLRENIEDRFRDGDRERAARTARLLRAESPERWQALLACGHPAACALAADLDGQP
jgi:glycosyltransferase involved in cell wall biosynthesis